MERNRGMAETLEGRRQFWVSGGGDLLEAQRKQPLSTWAGQGKCICKARIWGEKRERTEKLSTPVPCPQKIHLRSGGPNFPRNISYLVIKEKQQLGEGSHPTASSYSLHVPLWPPKYWLQSSTQYSKAENWRLGQSAAPFPSTQLKAHGRPPPPSDYIIAMC